MLLPTRRIGEWGTSYGKRETTNRERKMASGRKRNGKQGTVDETIPVRKWEHAWKY